MNIQGISLLNSSNKNIEFSSNKCLSAGKILTKNLNEKIAIKKRVSDLLDLNARKRETELKPFVEAKEYAVDKINKGIGRFSEFLGVKEQQIATIEKKFDAVNDNIFKEFLNGGFQNANNPVAKSLRRKQEKLDKLKN